MAITVFKENKNAAQPIVEPEVTGNAVPPSINQNTLNDFTRAMSPNGFSFDGGHASLYIYSPKPIPTQVLRSYTYQFKPDFIDAVTNDGYMTLQHAVAPGSHVPNVNQAILPDSEGRVADLTTWNNLWTFTLIVDEAQQTYANITPPKVRLIASGYFMDEPGTMVFGEFKPNPNAILVFTHVTNIGVRLGTSIKGGAVDGMHVTPSTWDFAGESIPIFYKDNMYLGTPADILSESKKSNLYGGFSSYEDMNLSNVKEGQGLKAIKSDLKAPKAQLNQIMEGIEFGIENTKINNPVYDTMSSNDDYIDPVNRSIDRTINELTGSNYIDFNRKFKVNKPISFGELANIYPNINVFPSLIRQGNGYGWDVASQVGMNNAGVVGPIVTPKQMFSSLASSVIQSVCSALGIATVAFSYRRIDGDGFMSGKQEAFQLCQFGLMVNRTNEQVLQEYAHRLKMYLDAQLFEVIHDNCGDFEINAMCDAAGTVLIDLHLYDFPDTQDGSYYQSESKLGGILNPAVCTQGIINNNVNQLCNMVSTICGRTFADQLYNSPQQPYQQGEI